MEIDIFSSIRDDMQTEFFIQCLRSGELLAGRRKDEMVSISTSLAKYLHENNIQNIVLLDRAARPTYVGLTEAWRMLYPDERRPGIWFVNPDIARDRLGPAEAAKELKETYPRLMKMRDSPVMVFDLCSHTEDGSLFSASRMFQEAGFKDIRTGLAQPPEIEYNSSTAVANHDFVALPHIAEAFCYPFGKDVMTKKGHSVKPERNEFGKHVAYARELRAEIRKAFRHA